MEVDSNFLYVTCSKFISDVIMFVSSAMATRDRSSESARFEILSAKYRSRPLLFLVFI